MAGECPTLAGGAQFQIITLDLDRDAQAFKSSIDIIRLGDWICCGNYYDGSIIDTLFSDRISVASVA